ncbi:enoyl-CoA hydratase [Paraburkholderia sp. 22B1P]|uniref:oxepin-CoA hydrolase, alternative type n=1 Tax=Paraburkholderia sp. 22B1P TaxID=3080498 RepID=UPI00308BE7F4|nr:enoyl-CoA hydratase [Paraburkholderia sp. 22B1P]
MSSEVVLTRREGAVLVLVNNNPTARNAVSPEFFEAATSALNEAESDASIGAIVIVGAGEYFCAGGNLRQIDAIRTKPPEHRLQRLNTLHHFIKTICNVKKPVIAAVEGGAAGAGMSLALACDILVSSQEASYVAAYVKVGLTPDAGLTSFLSEFIPRQLLTELCMTGAPVSAQRLHALGAINRLVDAGRAEAEAIAIGQRIAAGPARAIGRIKQLCHGAYARTLSEQLDAERQAMIESQGDEESGEGITAFLEKRTPEFFRLRQKHD